MGFFWQLDSNTKQHVCLNTPSGVGPPGHGHPQPVPAKPAFQQAGGFGRETRGASERWSAGGHGLPGGRAARGARGGGIRGCAEGGGKALRGRPAGGAASGDPGASGMGSGEWVGWVDGWMVDGCFLF